MLTQEDDVEIHALAKRGWSTATIAPHTGRDRKTGTRRRSTPSKGGFTSTALPDATPRRACAS